MENNNGNGAMALSFELIKQPEQEAAFCSQEYIDHVADILLDQFDEFNEVKSELANVKERLEKTLEYIFVDLPTGCFNINFYENLKKENFNPKTDQGKIAIVFIDVNGLKAINDTPIEFGGGHDAGDQMIKNVANYLRESFREDDYVIRPYTGGDEFFIICRNRNGEPDFGANLNARVDNIRNLTKEKSLPFSFATGVAVYDEQDSDLDETKKRAESLMYKCKKDMKK